MQFTYRFRQQQERQPQDQTREGQAGGQLLQARGRPDGRWRGAGQREYKTLYPASIAICTLRNNSEPIKVMVIPRFGSVPWEWQLRTQTNLDPNPDRSLLKFWLTKQVSRFSDPHWFNADPDTDADPTIFILSSPSADPDLLRFNLRDK